MYGKGTRISTLCIHVLLLNAWEGFTLNTSNALRKKASFPVIAEGSLFQAAPDQPFSSLRISWRLTFSRMAAWLHSQITHFPSFNCFNTRLEGSDCSRFAFTNNGFSPLCYGFHRVLLEFNKLFWQYHFIKYHVTKVNNTLIMFP